MAPRVRITDVDVYEDVFPLNPTVDSQRGSGYFTVLSGFYFCYCM